MENWLAIVNNLRKELEQFFYRNNIANYKRNNHFHLFLLLFPIHFVFHLQFF